MNTKPITEFNPNALKNVELKFSDWEKEPVNMQIRFNNFYSISSDLLTLLDAIEIIGFDSDSNAGTCAGLAQIAKKIIPFNEMSFLDDLFLKKVDFKDKTSEFINIDTILNEK